MQGDKQAVHVEDRQGVDQHVTRLPVPVVFEHPRVAQHVAVCQHRALAAPGGAAGVQNGGQVVGLPEGDVVFVRATRGAGQQRAGAVVAQGEDALGAGLEGDLADPAKVGRAAHHHGRLGVADEILDLRALVGGVQRQKNITRAQRRQIKHGRFHRLFDLHGDARACRQTQRGQQVGHHRRGTLQVAP